MSIKLERRIGINAPDDVVWEILSDIPAWSSWTGLYPRAEGELRIGARWDVDVALPGQPLRTVNPVILDWVPYDHIHWRLDTMRGWARTVRFLEIEKMGEENVIFSNGEIFDGWLGPSAARKLRRPIIESFEALNLALKEKAEAIWRERQISAK